MEGGEGDSENCLPACSTARPDPSTAKLTYYTEAHTTTVQGVFQNMGSAHDDDCPPFLESPCGNDIAKNFASSVFDARARRWRGEQKRRTNERANE